MTPTTVRLSALLVGAAILGAAELRGAIGEWPIDTEPARPVDRIYANYNYFQMAQGDRDDRAIRQPFANVTTKAAVAALNLVCDWNLLTNQSSSPRQGYTPPLAGPFSLALANVNQQLVAVFGPRNPAPNNLKAIGLALHDAMSAEFDNIPWGAQTGVSIAVDHFFGGPTPDIAVTTFGPGVEETAVWIRNLSGDTAVHFVPWAGYNGGGSLSSGDVNRDGRPDLAVAQNRGGRADIFGVTDREITRIVTGYPQGPTPDTGPSIKLIDTNNDGVVEIVAGAGPGQQPRVVIIDLSTPALPVVLYDFLAFPADRTGGVIVTGGLREGVPVIGAVTGHEVSTWLRDVFNDLITRTYTGSPFGTSPATGPVAFAMENTSQFSFTYGPGRRRD